MFAISLCSADSFYDCLLIACMRRVQEWSFLSILAEFRHNTWPHKLFDLEQFIERFDTSTVNVSGSVPEFISLHDNFKVGKMLCSYLLVLIQ